MMRDRLDNELLDNGFQANTSFGEFIKEEGFLHLIISLFHTGCCIIYILSPYRSVFILLLLISVYLIDKVLLAGRYLRWKKNKIEESKRND